MSQIPSQVYVIGFAKAYAHYLGLDEEEIVSSFKEALHSSPSSKVEDEDQEHDPSYSSLEAEPTAFQDITRMINAKQALILLGVLCAAIVGYKVIKSASRRVKPVTEEIEVPLTMPAKRSEFTKTSKNNFLSLPSSQGLKQESTEIQTTSATVTPAVPLPLPPKAAEESPKVAPSAADSSASQMSLLNLAKTSINRNKVGSPASSK